MARIAPNPCYRERTRLHWLYRLTILIIIIIINDKHAGMQVKVPASFSEEPTGDADRAEDTEPSADKQPVETDKDGDGQEVVDNDAPAEGDAAEQAVEEDAAGAEDSDEGEAGKKPQGAAADTGIVL